MGEGFFDYDVLAVLARDGSEAWFVTVPATALDGRDFELVMWDKNRLTIAVVDEFVSDELRRRDVVDDDDVSSVLGEFLVNVLNLSLLNVADPVNTNVDRVLDRLLGVF